MNLYVTIMYRYGDQERHSYLLGVFDNPVLALKFGENESCYRVRKYYPGVWGVSLNASKKRTTIISPKDAVSRDYFQMILKEMEEKINR